MNREALKYWLNAGALIVLICATCTATLQAGETVSIKLDGRALRCEVVKMEKEGVTVRANGTEQRIPLDFISIPELKECYLKIKDKSAQLRLDVGAHYLKKQLLDEAEEEINQALKLDAKLTDKGAPLLKQIAEKRAAARKEPGPKPVDNATKPPDKPKEEPAKAVEPKQGEDALQDYLNNLKDEEVPAKNPEDMKAWLVKRKDELKSKVGGEWRLIETAHFYCFSNLPEAKHRLYANGWLEKPGGNKEDPPGIYPLLCGFLNHKDGDKLWNNKCPIYYFETFEQFQRFAAEIDRQPGAANSGGYFSASGREVHICIPFMTKRLGEKQAERQARSTLYHEGTHAFLQLAGENVKLHRWLHEGMAQFVEFYIDSKNHPDRAMRVFELTQMVRSGDIASWESMRERPMGGMDRVGYSWAWAKFLFMYRLSLQKNDKSLLPKMIKLIKAGVNEDEAISKTFGLPLETIEAHFQKWVKDPKNFNAAE